MIKVVAPEQKQATHPSTLALTTIRTGNETEDDPPGSCSVSRAGGSERGRRRHTPGLSETDDETSDPEAEHSECPGPAELSSPSGYQFRSRYKDTTTRMVATSQLHVNIIIMVPCRKIEGRLLRAQQRRVVESCRVECRRADAPGRGNDSAAAAS
jgi:hypothetical protein